jgi:hypothetical protein
MRYLLILLTALSVGCARTWVNYPPRVIQGGVGADGKFVQGKVVAARAIELNGSDSLGATTIDVTNGGVHFASAGGIDNSTSTRAGYRTVRHGVSAIAAVATTGILAGQASNAYGANQGASAAASKANAGAATGAARAPAEALPAAGSTIQSTIPALVRPIRP